MKTSLDRTPALLGLVVVAALIHARSGAAVAEPDCTCRTETKTACDTYDPHVCALERYSDGKGTYPCVFDMKARRCTIGTKPCAATAPVKERRTLHTAAQLVELLGLLERQLTSYPIKVKETSCKIDISVIGGANLVSLLRSRTTTGDIDFCPTVPHPIPECRVLDAKEIERELGVHIAEVASDRCVNVDWANTNVMMAEDLGACDPSDPSEHKPWYEGERLTVRPANWEYQLSSKLTSNETRTQDLPDALALLKFLKFNLTGDDDRVIAFLANLPLVDEVGVRAGLEKLRVMCGGVNKPPGC